MAEKYRNEYNESTDEIFSRAFEKERETHNEVRISCKGGYFNADSCIPRENDVILYLHNLIIGVAFYTEISAIGESYFYTAYHLSKEYLEKEAFKIRN